MKKLWRKWRIYCLYRGAITIVDKYKKNPTVLVVRGDCSYELANMLFDKRGYSCRAEPIEEAPAYNKFIINY